MRIFDCKKKEGANQEGMNDDKCQRLIQAYYKDVMESNGDLDPLDWFSLTSPTDMKDFYSYLCEHYHDDEKELIEVVKEAYADRTLQVIDDHVGHPNVQGPPFDGPAQALTLTRIMEIEKEYNIRVDIGSWMIYLLFKENDDIKAEDVQCEISKALFLPRYNPKQFIKVI